MPKAKVVLTLIILILLAVGVFLLYYFFFRGPTPQMGLPPDGFTTGSNSMSFQFEAKKTDSILVVNKTIDTEISAVLNDGVFYAFYLPLMEGDNDLEAIVALKDGTLEVQKTKIKVQRARPFVYLSPSPSVGDTEPLEVKLVSRVDHSIKPARILIDLDGDGIIDEVKRFKKSVGVSYQKSGRYTPIVTILTKDGWLFSSDFETTPKVVLASKPIESPVKKYVSVGNDIADLERGPNEQLYVLSAADKAVYVYNQSDGSLAAKIDLPDVDGPRGMALDQEGNIYIADTGNRQILKLVADKGYQPDKEISDEGTFGHAGIYKEGFKLPEDVAVCEVEGEEKIFVADTGNDRIQRFNKYGKFELMFDGKGSAEGKLESPKGIICHGGGVIVVDNYNGEVRFFSTKGESLFSFDSSKESGTGELKNPHKISIDAKGFYVIADTDNNRVHLLRPNGTLYRTIEIPGKMPLAGITELTQKGWELFVAVIGESDLSQFIITEKIPGKGPGDILQAFMDALSNNDISGAKQYVAGRKWEKYDSLVQNSSELQRVIREINEAEGLKENWIHENSSSVSIFIQGGQVELEFILERNSVTDEWELVIF